MSIIGHERIDLDRYTQVRFRILLDKKHFGRNLRCARIGSQFRPLFEQ